MTSNFLKKTHSSQFSIFHTLPDALACTLKLAYMPSSGILLLLTALATKLILSVSRDKPEVQPTYWIISIRVHISDTDDYSSILCLIRVFFFSGSAKTVQDKTKVFCTLGIDPLVYLHFCVVKHPPLNASALSVLKL